jgi:dipeptidyl aminopeptidase/acylaminoacyl peptidase
LLKSIPSLSLILAAIFAFAVLTPAHAGSIYAPGTLLDVRGDFQTTLLVKNKNHDPIPTPPDGCKIVNYPAPLGSFPAIITNPITTGVKLPAIIWITGGFDNSIGDVWTPQDPSNDQTASAFAKAGIVTMYPSLRGGNDNPGFEELCFGEVNDIVAAAKYLASLPYVDPHRIYLGGHSTGGTLALLLAETTNRFRAVFSFGPVDAIGKYGMDSLPFDYNNKQELLLRSPVMYMDAVSVPTFVVEAADTPSNIDCVQYLAAHSSNPQLHFYSMPGYDHFSELAVSTPIVAQKILQDSGPQVNISLSDQPKFSPIGQ